MKKANKKTTLDDLAAMVKRGFDETAKKIDLDDAKTDLDGIKKSLEEFKESNTREHGEINLRLGNFAFRFELVELQKRVDILEKKVGARRR